MSGDTLDMGATGRLHHGRRGKLPLRMAFFSEVRQGAEAVSILIGGNADPDHK